MNAAAHGWVRVWLPPLFQNFGSWVIRSGESIGGPAQLIAVPPPRTTLQIEGKGLFGPAQFALSLSLEVYVEPGRVTEIHIPTYWLDQLAVPAGR